MWPTILIGLLFAALIAYAGIKSYKSFRSNKCPGCSGGCSGGSCGTRNRSA